MSDIPLHSLRRSRAGYTPLNRDTEMPAVNIIASTAAARLGARSKGKGRQRYADEDGEEGAALLGGGEHDGQYDDEFGEEVEARSSPVLSHSRPSSLSSKRSTKDKTRTVPFRPPDKLQNRFPPNTVRNQKYNAFTFLPIVFYEQFKFFFNLYFLLVALSQFVPALKIGWSQFRRLYCAISDMILRLYIDLYCSFGICPVSDNGQRGV
jgi:phospholipid-translocating ATPase